MPHRSRLAGLGVCLALWALLAPVALSPVVELGTVRVAVATGSVPPHVHLPGTPLVHPHTGSGQVQRPGVPDGVLAHHALAVAPVSVAGRFVRPPGIHEFPVSDMAATTRAELAGRPRGPPPEA